MNPNNYFLKADYRSHKIPRQYNDTEEDALTYQLEVYQYAAKIAQQFECQSVLDIGCGYALKLAKYLQPQCPKIVGIDQDHAINYCKSNHGFGDWIVDDLESPATTFEQSFDLIISADVIEHLIDPDSLLNFIRSSASVNTKIILSTPERDLRRGAESMGPPGNPAHIREWNKPEFAAYLKNRNLQIYDHQIMNLKEGMATCQTVLCSI
ncbi:class I SAM-dependent methyltransferase [Gilvimarinus sp. 1_MG-2023]|uniref:class I SAM-dependent methyltransferase n=1 Tax=Gilvimarinus sp. 1_MG-2023 TaxID=3062638 RepID=UPI0026E37FE6|nr:class I SAM-dependent methyltransferase [Gilvimarinus sp. 1_MG-2023]MDO6746275.1 class I SAM-dependent methyltransferase [Gilvimarinus sp. 1_MG-2023]